MPITIKEIAEIAGVSRGTVDRALNGREGIKKDVADNILTIAEEHGYKPNRAARALATKSKGRHKLGIIINSEGNPFYDEVKKGIAQAKAEFSESGIKIITKKLKGYDKNKQLAAIDELLSEGISGLAITPINHKEISDKLAQLEHDGIPVVTVNLDIEKSKRSAYVGCDYIASGKTAATLMGMILQQEAKLAVVIGSSKVLGHGQRKDGFCQVIDQVFPYLEIDEIIENQDDDTVSYKEIKNLLRTRKDIKGIYFTAGGIGGGLSAVKELGLEHKIKIITCDMIPSVKEKILDGTVDATICQEPYRQGYDSLRILSEYIINGKMSRDDIITKLEIKLKYNVE